MTSTTANRIYDILVQHAGAIDDPPPFRARETFVITLTDRDGLREYRFGGSLGFGGKFWNETDRWRVSCYSEDMTPARRYTIEATNEALAALRAELEGEGP